VKVNTDNRQQKKQAGKSPEPAKGYWSPLWRQSNDDTDHW